MTPEEVSRIVSEAVAAAIAPMGDKLDGLVDDSRDTNSRVRTIEAGYQILATTVREHGERLRLVETRVDREPEDTVPVVRHMSPSFTNEIASAVGGSIAPAMQKAMRPTVSSTWGASALLALAILAYVIFGHH